MIKLPRHSGKSCIREGLKQAILLTHREGSWYAETVRHNHDLAKQLKEAYQAKFTLEFAQEKANILYFIGIRYFIMGTIQLWSRQRCP